MVRAIAFSFFLATGVAFLTGCGRSQPTELPTSKKEPKLTREQQVAQHQAEVQQKIRETRQRIAETSRPR